MASEQQGFVFAVVFMIVFSTLLSTMPVGLLGEEETPENLTPLNPAILTDFTDYENYTKSAFSPLTYEYSLGGRDWFVGYSLGTFLLGAKVFWWIFWFGQLDSVKFNTYTGNDRGTGISFDEIAEDAEEGQVRYSLTFTSDGNNAGGFVIYWNSTEYETPEEAWNDDELYLLHGVGIDSTITSTNILGLLFSLLFLRLPDVPITIGILLAVGPWASIIYIIWFIIVNMIPFLGGGG